MITPERIINYIDFLFMRFGIRIHEFYFKGDRLFQLILDRKSIINPFMNQNEALFHLYYCNIPAKWVGSTIRMSFKSAHQSWHEAELPHDYELIQANNKNLPYIINWLKGIWYFHLLDYFLFSITLGIYFLILQGFEYSTVPFHINDTVFGSFSLC